MSSSDDYWNASAGASFQFDDDPVADRLQNTQNGDVIFEPKPQKTLLPIEQLLSTESLDIVLDDLQFNSQVPKDTDNPIKVMVCKRPFLISCHKSIQQKLDLLDGAIASNDGDTILYVLLFLRSTLEDQLFLKYITSREVALQLYISYLLSHKETSKLESLYMLGFIHCSPLRLLSLYIDEIFPKEVKLSRAMKFQTQYSSFMTRDIDKLIIDKYITFLRSNDQ